jgi:hypothetical protein
VADKSKRRTAAKAPISAHPAFPAIVALWFAALLGLGSLVLPVQLFERASEVMGLASVVAAAQAPLGVTARILVAATAAGFGATLGLVLAGRLAAASRSRPARKRGSEQRVPANRPISAHEEFGDPDFADDDFSPRDFMPGRRELSVSEDGAGSEFLEAASLPGNAEPESPAFESEPVVAEEVSAEEIIDELPAEYPINSLELTGLHEELEPADVPSWQGAAAPVPQPQLDPNSEEASMRDFAATSTPQHSAPASGSEPIAALVARFARALEQHRESARAEDAAAVAPTPEPLVDLTFALGSRTPEPEVVAEAVEVPARALPTAPRPVGWDAADDDHDDEEFADEGDDGYSSLLAMKNPATLPREAVRIEDESSEDDFVPEPVVVFPGQAAREATPFASPSPLRPFDAPAARVEALASVEAPSRGFAPAAPATRDTERALREALEKLQRMSGAA